MRLTARRGLARARYSSDARARSRRGDLVADSTVNTDGRPSCASTQPPASTIASGSGAARRSYHCREHRSSCRCAGRHTPPRSRCPATHQRRICAAPATRSRSACSTGTRPDRRQRSPLIGRSPARHGQRHRRGSRRRPQLPPTVRRRQHRYGHRRFAAATEPAGAPTPRRRSSRRRLRSCASRRLGIAPPDVVGTS